MRLEVALRLFFIVYCIEAGVFLVLAPWSPAWDRFAVQVPVTRLAALLLHPALRGGVSGFGLFHLVWGAHDLDRLLTWRRSRGRVAS